MSKLIVALSIGTRIPSFNYSTIYSKSVIELAQMINDNVLTEPRSE